MPRCSFFSVCFQCRMDVEGVMEFLREQLLLFQAEHSPTINLILVMVLIWGTGVLFRKIKQPPVLGELLAGIIFGPALLNIIRPDATMEILSELGVFCDLNFYLVIRDLIRVPQIYE